MKALRRTALGFAALTVVLSALPANAVDGTSIADTLIVGVDTQAAGACSFLFSGPSTDPSSTPYHIAGYAEVRSAKVVVSTSIRCRIKRYSDGTQVGPALAQAAPGSSVSVVGDIPVGVEGPFRLCTRIDAVFSDTSRLNPNGTEQCRLMTSSAAVTAHVDPLQYLRDFVDDLFGPAPPPPM